jgi:hypothetical protein
MFLFPKESFQMKMKKSLAIALSLILVLIIAGTASAIKVVTYTDMAEIAVGDYIDDYWFAPDGGGANSVVVNGDFNMWTSGLPDYWDVWADSKSGWEDAHLAMANLAVGGDGENYGLGLFVRNVGGSAGYYAGIAQQLDIPEGGGNYWTTVHATMFGEYLFFEAFGYLFVDGDNVANAFAWYAIDEHADASDVTGWKEMFSVYDVPTAGDPVPGWTACPNPYEACFYVGRYETNWVDAGDYMHIMVGHKFSTYNVWTTFIIDDISMTPADGDVIEDGFWVDGVLGWNDGAAR